MVAVAAEPIADLPQLPEDGNWVFAKASWFSSGYIRQRAPTLKMVEKEMMFRERLRSTGQWGKLAQNSSEMMVSYPRLASSVALHEFRNRRRKQRTAAKRSLRLMQRLHPVPAGPLALEDGADAAEMGGKGALPSAEVDDDVSAADSDDVEHVLAHLEEAAAEEMEIE